MRIGSLRREVRLTVEVGGSCADGESNPFSKFGDRSEHDNEPATIVRRRVVLRTHRDRAAKRLAGFDMVHQFLDIELDTHIAGHSSGKVGGSWAQRAFAGHCNDGRQRHPGSACGKRQLNCAGNERAFGQLRQGYCFL